MTLSEKSLQTIELPAVLAQLASDAICPVAKDTASKLRPFTDIGSVINAQKETTCAKDMMVLKQCPPFSGVIDVSKSLSRAKLGGVLNTRELLNVASLLRATSSSVSYARKEKESEETFLDDIFSRLKSNKPLEERLSFAIISEDEISDNASGELASIRRKINITHDKIRQSLGKIISSQTYAKALQEPIITIKNNRYVVPVKTEHKSAISGIVHDISASGATQFIEPTIVVELGNELKSLNVLEENEIERILSELSAEVSIYEDEIISNFDTLVKLDLIFAKAKLSYKQDAISPQISEEKEVSLVRARHPLIDKNTVVPIDIRLGKDCDTLIITGPNTGGKTVALKTLGLLCAMAQCGLHIPACHGSIVGIFSSILADIGDEQSIYQSLSTFSSHMKNIVSMLDVCTFDTLLLFDELGAGTDPVEGAALAISIIQFARKTGALVAATTHFAELKTFAVTTKGVLNASCEFDVDSLMPTYRLIIGVPGKSNAFAISERLGLSIQIIEEAKNIVSRENKDFEDAILILDKKRAQLDSEKIELEIQKKAASDELQKVSELKSALDSKSKRADEAAKRETRKILDDARERVDSVLDRANEILQSAMTADVSEINKSKADIYRELNLAESELFESTFENSTDAVDETINPGDTVIIKQFGTVATVESISPDGVLSLLAGNMKISARVSEVTKTVADNTTYVKSSSKKSEAKLRNLQVPPEIDLRGAPADEAIHILESYLDQARLAKLSVITIIHGKGTGALRKAVTSYLNQEKSNLTSFRLGRYGEGEDGVTIVQL